jgi:predicted Zn-ribbon and HTH transcriptional regulator
MFEMERVTPEEIALIAHPDIVAQPDICPGCGFPCDTSDIDSEGLCPECIADLDDFEDDDLDPDYLD